MELRRQYRARRNAGALREIGSKDKCCTCGEIYIVEYAPQKYCSRECALIGKKDYYEKRYIEKIKGGN